MVTDQKIRRLTIFEEIRYFFSPSYREKVKANLKFELSCSLFKQNQKLQTIKKLTRLSSEIFDRSKIHSETLEELRKEIRAKKESEGFSLSYPVSLKDKGKFEELVDEILLAQELGLKTKSGGGFTESFVLKNLKDEACAIFKTPEGESHSLSNPSLFLRSVSFLGKKLGLINAIHSAQNGNGYLSESVAYIIDQHMQTNLVCPSGVIKNFKINGKIHSGSIQEFTKKPFQHGCEFLKSSPFYRGGHAKDEKWLEKNAPAEEIEKLMVLDLVLGNFDRHGMNWLIRDGKEIIAIDNSFSMSTEHAQSRIEKNCANTFLNRLPFAKKQISENGKNLIEKLHNNCELLKDEIHGFYTKHGMNAEEAHERIKRMEERINTLYKNRKNSFSKIAEIVENERIEALPKQQEKNSSPKPNPFKFLQQRKRR